MIHAEQKDCSRFALALIGCEEDICLDLKMTALRTLVVDDHEDLRRLLRSILQAKTECVVVGEATDGLQAIELASELHPDLILLDLALPKLNGLEAGRQILKLCPQSKIVFLSQNQSPEVAQGALRMGAAGYLLKSDATELPIAVEAVLQGKVYVSRRVKTS